MSYYLKLMMPLSFLIIALNSQCKNPEADLRLVVIMVVDQMRADHLSRLQSLYKGGFQKLFTEGVVFREAFHAHGATKTGPGHATIATGTHPSTHGIVGNSWFDRPESKEVNCVEDSNSPILNYEHLSKETGRSPERLQVPAIGDWLKSVSPKSKVFGVSRKDRSAVLSAGHRANGAYWFSNDDGNMVTSRHFTDQYPEWVVAFNKARHVDHYFERTWEKCLPESAYTLARADTCIYENDGHALFPHGFKSGAKVPDRGYYDRLQSSPFMEEFLLQFTRNLLQHEELGKDAAADLLFIGFSAADNIGHNFGPMSQESMDYFLRLDSYLDEFLTYLDSHIGKGRYQIVLTSDHGVLPIPEELTRQGVHAVRLLADSLRIDFKAALKALAFETGIQGELYLRYSNGSVYVDYDVASRSGITAMKLDSLVQSKLREHWAVADVYTKAELSGRSACDRPLCALFVRSYQPERCGDFMIRLKENYLQHSKAYGTNHGSPYPYDRHIPLIFLSDEFMPATLDEEVYTVDIAPTIAEILAIRPPANLDGKSLVLYLKEQSRSQASR